MAFNMDPKKCPMPTQDPKVRAKNFEEVALGYTPEMAVSEAKRCVHCKNKPCVDGPDFDGDLVDFDEAMARGSMYRPFEKHAREEACHLFQMEVN